MWGVFMLKTCDYLIIGGGIIGLGVAYNLRKKYPSASISLIEKEPKLGYHASGRNSGVIHAGFYYTTNSLKARFTRNGNIELKRFCKEHGIPINECGKLVVAKNEAEDKLIDELYSRGIANGVPLEILDLKSAQEVEPRVKTFERAIYSPSTASVDPLEVLKSLYNLCKAQKIEISFNEKYIKNEENKILTNRQSIQAGFVINCAGAYADRIAHNFGEGYEYKMIPFKGLYLYSSEKPGALRTHIYPVPDLNIPFLGVHYTLTVDNKIKIGPTAQPALWMENYSGLKNFSLREFIRVARLGSKVIYSDPSLRLYAFHEYKKLFRKNLVKMAQTMVKDSSEDQFRKWGKPGIRAQLVHLPSKSLEMDFVVRKNNKSVHVLNAVSPAFTCSLPFSEYVSRDI